MNRDFSGKEKPEHAELLPKVHEAVASKSMWVYSNMFLLLGEVLESMTALGRHVRAIHL